MKPRIAAAASDTLRNSGQGGISHPQPRRRPIKSDVSPIGHDGFAVVAIGASAGGLEACKKLVHALPVRTGMAFILVQHLDPTHESMMVELLATHTSLKVKQAAEGMPIQPEHLYVIPPGSYLSVSAGVLRVSEPEAPHGRRLPFDFLLHALARHYGSNARCLVLSGTGADGSIGVRAVKENGGLVIVQRPEEAGYDGMPRSAIATGVVDLVLPVAEIPDALIRYDRRAAVIRTRDGENSKGEAKASLPGIIELLRAGTPHDFTSYKRGTLQRRVERRMALATIEIDDFDRYLAILQRDSHELDLLAKDLLINVTQFFRDASVFDFLAQTIIPELVRRHPTDRPLRIWIPGCSTGEEAFSLAILFMEEIAAAKRKIKLQVFASDANPEAAATARDGTYHAAIAGDVSPARLARFFVKEEHGFRASSELRAAIVFTVHDVLADPPFSRLDFISCRNLLIYLAPEAQAKAMSLFHFALREDGILLLGPAESVGNDSRFEAIGRAERVYRHVGRSRPGDVSLIVSSGPGARVPTRLGQPATSLGRSELAELCQQLVLGNFAPAAVLISGDHQILYSTGPSERYLRVAPGHATYDLLAMVHRSVRIKLWSAIHQASDENHRTVVSRARAGNDRDATSFSIVVQPVTEVDEKLFLVCFIDELKPKRMAGGLASAQDVTRVAELEMELESTRTELQRAVQRLESDSERQKTLNQEALSVNEEYQTANEELLTSKEELQSLNEELTALNSQLQETLERQRTTSNDLQNVLYSTDLATLFLDADLNIRYFTPATKILFHMIPTDVGRPLADLSSLSGDSALLIDAKSVLNNKEPLESEIETGSGAWFIRRVLPYRTQDGVIEGVVVTFADVTEQRRAADALRHAERQAHHANAAKSRFLTAASHDLRQPLQTLTLLQGLLAKTVEGTKAEELVSRLYATLGSMSGMLDTLLDISQIEAGIIQAEMIDFQVNELFERLREEFAYRAEAQGLNFRVVPCGLVIHSDPTLVEQIIRNLLSNALKYTVRGKVLLGCRRRNGKLSIEIWDTGVGIPANELQSIFEEYRQLDNPARERARGLGLGLSIVQRLSALLNHPVRVRSHRGKGSVFSMEAELLPGEANLRPRRNQHAAVDDVLADHRGSGFILVVEDDPEVGQLLQVVLEERGYQIRTAPDGVAAQGVVAREHFLPDLILTDYNLPNGLNGLQLIAKLRKDHHREIPVVIITGDTSADASRAIADQDCERLIKPVKPTELVRVIERLLSRSPAASQEHASGLAEPVSDTASPVVYVVDDDQDFREAMRSVLEDDGRVVEDYPDAEAFLLSYRPGREACLLIDAYLPGMAGLELLGRLRDAGYSLPAIMITGRSDVPMAVQAMKAGASDFIEKPVRNPELLAGIQRVLDEARDKGRLSASQQSAVSHIASLTVRQRQVMDLVLAGHPNKNIAADLAISQRTVENHRASIMQKTGSKSLPALARLALTAARFESEDSR